MTIMRGSPALTDAEIARAVIAAFEAESKRLEALDEWQVAEEDRRLRTRDNPRVLSGDLLTSAELAAYAARAFRMREDKTGVALMADALGMRREKTRCSH